VADKSLIGLSDFKASTYIGSVSSAFDSMNIVSNWGTNKYLTPYLHYEEGNLTRTDANNNIINNSVIERNTYTPAGQSSVTYNA
jgi:hypothetical protein